MRQFKKTRCMVLLCSLMLLLPAGCGIHFENYFGETSQNRITEDVFVTPPPESSDFVVTDTMERYDYSVKNTLNKAETGLYNRLIAKMENYEFVFEFENVDSETFKKVYYAVLYDHPEIFWLGLNYSYSVRTLGDYSRIRVEPDLFSNDQTVVMQARERLNETVREVAARASQCSGVFEKVRLVHDYIVDQTTYDSETLSLVMTGRSKGLLSASTAYGCLVEGKAVCSGYSAAFQLMMQELGIESGRVNGTRISEEGPHQWNYVCLDGDYYYVDATWDDPIKSDGASAKTYDYFLISENDLAYTHRKDEDLPVPVCNGTRYNYFRYCGLYFEQYDFSYIQYASDMLRADGSFSVKFSSPELLEEAVDELITNQRIFDIDYINGGISYSVSSSGCILTIKY